MFVYTHEYTKHNIYIYTYIRICRTVLFFFNTHHRLEAMAHGVHPECDFEGHPLPAMHAKWNGKPIAGDCF